MVKSAVFTLEEEEGVLHSKLPLWDPGLTSLILRLGVPLFHPSASLTYCGAKYTISSSKLLNYFYGHAVEY